MVCIHSKVESMSMTSPKQTFQLPENLNLETRSATRLRPNTEPKKPPVGVNNKCNKCGFIIHNEDHLSKHMKVRHGKKNHTLWVADSIHSNVDFDSLAKETDTIIKTVKAYQSVPGDSRAHFPGKSFLEVVDKEVAKQDFRFLVLGGGSVDISILDTDGTLEPNIEDLKAKTITSASQLFCIAEACLHDYGHIQKVVLLNRTPRFDQNENDPLRLKPQLSNLANSVYFELWCKSKFRDKIVLGEHNLPLSLDQDHLDIYGDPEKDADYDGVHFRGPSGRYALTSSIIAILRRAQIAKGPTENTAPKEPRVPSGQNKLSTWKAGIKYDPMNIFKERMNLIRKKSLSDDPSKFKRPSVIQAKQTSPPNFSTRTTSVIHSNTNLQEDYNIPVSNPFNILLN